MSSEVIRRGVEWHGIKAEISVYTAEISVHTASKSIYKALTEHL